MDGVRPIDKSVSLLGWSLDLWHLLSLDAPTVAVLWTFFAVKVTRSVPYTPTYLAIGIAVWLVYALDRLLDSMGFSRNSSEEISCEIQARHRFHRRNSTVFVAVIVLGLGVLTTLLTRFPKPEVLAYLLDGLAFSVYFGLVHSDENPERVASRHVAYLVPKEFLVGPFFAATVFIPTIYEHAPNWGSVCSLAILFAVLCTLNCLYIFRWEHANGDMGHRATVNSIRHLDGAVKLFAFISLGSSLYLSLTGHFVLMLFPLACGTSAFLLHTIHRYRSRLSLLRLRAAADAVLLTPLFFLPFLLR